MDKGKLNEIFFRGQTTHRIPKLLTLAVTSCVFFAMVSLDASASTSAPAATTATLAAGVVTSPTGTVSTPAGYRGQSQLSSSTVNAATLKTSKKRTAPLKGSKAPSVATNIDHFTGSFGTRNKASKHTATTTTTSPFFGTTTTTPVTTTTQPPRKTTTAPTTTTSKPPSPTTTTTSPPPTTTTTAPSGPAPNVAYPIGTPDASEPSGYAPPSSSGLSGYTQTYVSDFTGSSLPSAWGTYEGQPGGDPGAQFDQAHVTVSGGMLNINTFQDSAFNNEWVTGGACMCNLSGQLYGAWFVRSRLTGPGPTGVELLWPDASVWPPEIDFNETFGGTSSTSATVHYDAANSQIAKSLNIDMTQWHTWGVVWTPSWITYTVDGNVWATVTSSSSIPTIPMHLSLQAQTWCASSWACPTTPQSMQVDWVAQYRSN